MPAKFPLGQVVATPAALKALERAGQDAAFFLDKHAQGDWGELCIDDQKLNDQAIRAGERLVSLFETLTGDSLLIITESDRSVTTILLPEEY